MTVNERGLIVFDCKIIVFGSRKHFRQRHNRHDTWNRDLESQHQTQIPLTLFSPEKGTSANNVEPDHMKKRRLVRVYTVGINYIGISIKHGNDNK